MATLRASAIVLLGAALLLPVPQASAKAHPKKPHAAKSHAAKPAAKVVETIGGGTVNSPAVGPPPSFGLGGSGMTLVKNWHFGTDGTIKNYADMSANFVYH